MGEGQEHEVMETQAAKGGPHMPWERDELWAPFISPVAMVMGGQGGDRPFPFKDLVSTGIRARYQVALGPRDQESRPHPSSSDLGSRVPHHFRPGVHPTLLRPGV